MIEQHIRLLMKYLGRPSEPGLRGAWVHCSCPFAPWTHSGGTDKDPSFGIIAKTGRSFYKCWSCGVKGDLDKLVMELVMRKKSSPPPWEMDLKAALQLIATEESEIDAVDLEEIDYDELKWQKSNKFIPYPELWLDGFLKSPQHPYLKGRNIPLDVGQWLDVRFDFSKARVCFPIRTFEGTLAGIQGRLVVKGEPRYFLYPHPLAAGAYKDGKHYNRMVWGNEHNASLEKPLVLCEGFFDLASIARVYRNVICSLTSEITPEKFERIQDADYLISFYDFGTGGDKARELIDAFATKKGIAVEHLVPDIDSGDPGNLSIEEVSEAMDYALTLPF